MIARVGSFRRGYEDAAELTRLSKVVFSFLLVVGLILPGCTRSRQSETRPTSIPPRARTAWFEESAAQSGILFRHRAFDQQRFYFPEIMPGGVALFDYDNDGDLDLYFVQSGDLTAPNVQRPGNELYRNDGGGVFENVTEIAGVGDRGYGMGCTCADYDRDGDVDLYVTNLGANVLYRNNGNGTFTDVTAHADVGDKAWGTSCAFVDYNGDHLLDLYIANYVNWSPDREVECWARNNDRDYCTPKKYREPAGDTLYRNDGDGTFRDVSAQVGLQDGAEYGLGVACADYDGDGLMDIYVANDGTPNQLWLHEDPEHLKDAALLAGCALSGTGATEAGMGVIAVDIDSDGDSDLFISHIRNETNRFYINDKGVFDDFTSRLGLAAPSLMYTGFGLGFADFNHDGLLDLFVANGRVTLQEPIEDRDNPYAEGNLLFEGEDNLRFKELEFRGGTNPSLVATSRGAAFGDIDNDGDVDIVVANLGSEPHILKNIAPKRGTWIGFRVLDRYGSDALGARVRIETESRVQWRTVQTAYSYCSSNDPRVHFGLGDIQRVSAVEVSWPDGTHERFGPFVTGAYQTLQQGQGMAP